MTPKGKKKLIKSLAEAIGIWLDTADPNSEEESDIGYVGDKFLEHLASLVVTALELNSASQVYMEKEGLLFLTSAPKPKRTLARRRRRPAVK